MRCGSVLLRSLCFEVFTILIVMSSGAAARSAFTLTATAHGMRLNSPGGKVVFEYNTRKPENIGLTSPSAAYFDPVNTPSGERVTNAAPDDHPHHRGIFLGFLDSEFRSPTPSPKGSNKPTYAVHRADYWGWGVYAPREGRVIENRRVRLTYADANVAQLEIENAWIADDQKMLDETDWVTVTEKDGMYVLDLIYRLAPLVPYVILQQAFGGFAVQGQKYGDSYYSTAWGKATFPAPNYSNVDLDWPAEPWYDYTIKLKSDGKTVGFSVVDHPLNPPTRWHNVLWFLNPCINSYGPITIEPTLPLILRYRVIVHDGPPKLDLLQKLAVEFRQQNRDSASAR